MKAGSRSKMRAKPFGFMLTSSFKIRNSSFQAGPRNMLVKSSISWHFQSVATCLSGKNRYVAHLIDDLKFCDVAVGIWPLQKGLPELMNLIGVILSLACYLSCPWNKTALHVKSLIGRRGVGPNQQNIAFFYRKLEAGLNFCALTTTDESNLSVWIF